MGRKPRISRDALLDAAEAIVTQQGASALTIEALAQALGISKGGVQYSFASKDVLIQSLVERSLGRFDKIFSPEMPGGPMEVVRAYLCAVRSTQTPDNVQLTGLMLAYFQNPASQAQTREWYQTMLERVAGDSQDARRARLAYLAIEGLYSMQMLGLVSAETMILRLNDIEAELDR